MKHLLNDLIAVYQQLEIYAHIGHDTMSKITQSAKGENCAVRIIGYCNSNSETVVLAHINGIRYGHGVGNKVNDIHGAYCCSSCHDALDGRIRTNHSKDSLKLWHLEGIIETQIKLLNKGLIKC